MNTVKISKELYRQMVEASPASIMTVRDEEFVFVNPAAARMFGYSAPKEMLRMSVWKVLPPESYRLIKGRIKRFESGLDNPYEQIKMLRKDGRLITVESASVPLKGSDKSAAVIIARDISDRIKLESELKESRKRFKSLFENAPEAMVIIDIQTGKFVGANEHALKLFGYTHKDFVELGPLDISPPLQPDGRASRELVQDKIQELVVNKPETFEWVHKHSSGKDIICEIHHARLPSGKQNLFCAIAIDITEKKHLEKDLKESEERFRSFMDNLPAEVYIKDDNDRHIYGNKEVLKGMKKKPDEFIGLTTQDFFPSEIADRLIELDRKIIHENAPKIVEEWRNIAKDDKRWRRDIKFPIRLESGKNLLGGIAIDITDIKLSGEKLKTALSEIKILKNQLEKENIFLKEEIKAQYSHETIVGKSNAINNILGLAEKVAAEETSVLITGETGTGKEMLARAIHDMSPRKRKTMITVNCAALPETLIESELFGREKGAFTGAISKRVGRFEAADGSTIFLDEIGDLPAEMQVKLLRVLHEGQFERLGSSASITVDTRVVAATNRNQEQLVREGKFRNDLYYRLNVFPIELPPLRERSEDIPMLVWHFVEQYRKSMNKIVENIPKHTMAMLRSYAWPGNIRELKNVIERSMILTTGRTLQLGRHLLQKGAELNAPKLLRDVEKNHIQTILNLCHWKVSGKKGAAEMLGLKESTLRARMKKLGIQRNK